MELVPLVPRLKAGVSVLLAVLEQIVLPPLKERVAVPDAAGMVPKANVPPSIFTVAVVRPPTVARFIVVTSTTLFGLGPMMNVPRPSPVLPVLSHVAMYSVPIMALTWPREKSMVPVAFVDAAARWSPMLIVVTRLLPPATPRIVTPAAEPAVG